MTYDVCYSKDKTTNSTHVKTIIRTKTVILAIHIHSTLATLHPLQGRNHAFTSLQAWGTSPHQ